MRPKIGINGLGRIGKLIARNAILTDRFDIVAINSPNSTAEMLAYSLKYDSVYRTFDPSVSSETDQLIVGDKKIKIFNKKTPAEIPWGEVGVDIVIDSSGVFETRDELSGHLRESVKKVILTAPTADEKIPHVVLGVNEKNIDLKGDAIISNASCTTNCAAILLKVLKDSLGVEAAFLNTIHAYTSTQRLLDGSAKQFTRGRAAAISIIPTTTGADTAICKVVGVEPKQMGAMAIRVPVPTVSLTELTANTEKTATVEEINTYFRLQALGELKPFLSYETTPLVSADYIGSPYSCIFDANYTQVLGGSFVRITGWYDNEWGYSSRVVDLVDHISELL